MYKNFNDMRLLAFSSSVRNIVNVIKTITLPLHECYIGPLHREDRPQPIFATEDNAVIVNGIEMHVGNDGFNTQVVINNRSLHILHVYRAYVKAYNIIKKVYPSARLSGFKRDILNDLEWLYSPVIKISNERPQNVLSKIRSMA